MKETIAYNKDGIRTVTFHYKGTENDLNMLMKMIIKDCISAKLESSNKKA